MARTRLSKKEAVVAYNQAKWFSGAVILESTNVLVFECQRCGETKLKLPGGNEKSGNGRNDRSPEETLRNELVGDHEVLESGDIRIVERFWSRSISSTHTQYWFLVELLGKLRRSEKDDAEPDEVSEVLGVPFFMDIVRFHAHRNALQSHREVVEEFARKMGRKCEDWYYIARSMNAL